MIKMNEHFKLAKFLANLLDNQYKIGKFRVGIDPLLGLIPFWGDFLTFILSLYIILIGIKSKLPVEKLAQMLGNTVFDLCIGIVPLLGDIADFSFKSNLRNLKILEEHLGEEIIEGEILNSTKA